MFRSVYRHVQVDYPTDLGIEKERLKFIRQIKPWISDRRGEPPNLLDVLRPGEIESLLSECVKHVGTRYRVFVEFVARSGYEHVPDLAEDGKPRSRRTTALHHAARSVCSYRSAIAGLLQIYSSCDVNYIDETGLTHFHVACQFGHDDIVNKFLELGQDPNGVVTKTGESPLHLAMIYGKRTIVETLLKHGADPNAVNEEGSTPLHIVCRYGPQRVKLFLEMCENVGRTVDIDARDKSGYTALHLALRDQRDQAVVPLLRAGASPNIANEKGQLPLHSMCDASCDFRLVDAFFEIDDGKQHDKVQIDARDNEGNTPLILALGSERNTRLVEKLLRRGADPNAANEKGQTPLHRICQMHHNFGLADVFFKICDQKRLRLRVDDQDDEGNTPLHLALGHGRKIMAQVLVGRGADPNVANKQGETPLHFICKQLCFCPGEFFKICDENFVFVQIDARDKLGRTPLQLAVASIFPHTVETLLNRGAEMSRFVFPTESYYGARFDFDINNPDYLTLQVASGIFITIELLQTVGYELNQSDALTIMKFFAKRKMFEEPEDLENFWYNDKTFTRQLAKETMVIPNLAIYDLIRMQPEEAAKLLTYTEYFEFSLSDTACRLPYHCGRFWFHCLCEKLSRGFFRGWTVYPFWELIHRRLPLECCEMIIGELTNEDLCNICLAAIS